MGPLNLQMLPENLQLFPQQDESFFIQSQCIVESLYFLFPFPQSIRQTAVAKLPCHIKVKMRVKHWPRRELHGLNNSASYLMRQSERRQKNAT